MDAPIESLVDIHTHQRLDELVRRIKTIVDWSKAPANIPGWCACRGDSVFEDVVRYVQQELAISPEQRYDIAFDAARGGYLLHDMLDRLQYDEQLPRQEPLLVAARGIENFTSLNAHLLWAPEYCGVRSVAEDPQMNGGIVFCVLKSIVLFWLRFCENW